MIALSTILLPLIAAAPSKTTSLVGNSRLVETRVVSPSGHEEVSWSRSETRIHLLVDHQRYGTNRYYYVLRSEDNSGNLQYSILGLTTPFVTHQ
jgi:hypothetical protein